MASSWDCSTSSRPASGSVVHALPGLAEGDGEGDEALLGAVVEVALDAAALGLGAVDGRGAAGLQLGDPGLEVAAPGRGRAASAASAPPSRARATVAHGATQGEPERADHGEADGAGARADLEQPELGGAAGQAADVEGEGEQGGRPAPGDHDQHHEVQHPERQQQEGVGELLPAGPVAEAGLPVGPPRAGAEGPHRIGERHAEQHLEA